MLKSIRSHARKGNASRSSLARGFAGTWNGQNLAENEYFELSFFNKASGKSYIVASSQYPAGGLWIRGYDLLVPPQVRNDLPAGEYAVVLARHYQDQGHVDNLFGVSLHTAYLSLAKTVSVVP